jgi:hypothetical protein
METADVSSAAPWKRWETWALLVWAGSFLVVSIRVACLPTSRTVYQAYVEAGRNWRAGQNLYQTNGGYRYCPPVTMLFAGLSHLPDGLAGILWRFLGVAVFVGSLAWWARVGLPRSLTRSHLGLLFLLTLPLALSSVNNGQANVLLIGLLVLAVTGPVQQRWNLVAVCLAAAILLKAYPAAIALLLVVQYPRQLCWRLPLALAAGLALPFLFQDATYVAHQFQGWLANLHSDDRTDWTFENSYRDLWLLFRLWSLPLSHDGYVVLQLAGGAAVAALCLAGRWAGWEQRRLLVTLLGLGSCWMMLLGPATESCTYALVAPSLAWAVLEGYTDRRFYWARGAVTVSYVVLLSALAAGWFPFAGRAHACGIHPLATLVLLGVLLVQAVSGLRPVRRATEPAPVAPPAKAA